MSHVLCSECYIQKDNKTLMLHRTKKKNDINHEKWIGVGGKFEAGESPEECLLREVKEEAGVTLTSYRMRGVITFVVLGDEGEGKLADEILIFVFTADGFTGDIIECDEGDLSWIDNDKILDLNLWEGDRVFWEWLLSDKPFFSAKFTYRGDKMLGCDVKFHENHENR